MIFPSSALRLQHVTAREAPLQICGLQETTQQGFASPDDMSIAANHDIEMAKFLVSCDFVVKKSNISTR